MNLASHCSVLTCHDLCGSTEPPTKVAEGGLYRSAAVHSVETPIPMGVP